MIKIREIQNREFEEYLKNNINKGFYKYCHEYLAPKWSVTNLNVYGILKKSYSNALIFMDNYLNASYELNDYFTTKFKKIDTTNTENLIIEVIGFSFFQSIITSLTENIILNNNAEFIIDETLRSAVSGGKFNFYKPVDEFMKVLEKKLIKPTEKGYYEHWFSDVVINEMYVYIEQTPFNAQNLMSFREFVYDNIFPMQSEVLNAKSNLLKWHGTKTELIELTKALIENGTLKGKQEDIFNSIQSTFDVELKNIDQAITKFSTRGNETKFLDKLKDTLFKYITNKLD